MFQKKFDQTITTEIKSDKKTKYKKINVKLYMTDIKLEKKIINRLYLYSTEFNLRKLRITEYRNY